MNLKVNFNELIQELRQSMKNKYDRHVSIQDLLSDRWETAKFYGFGDGTSCYNNVLIIGDVKVEEYKDWTKCNFRRLRWIRNR